MVFIVLQAIERIGEYLEVDQEATATSVKPPPAYWPSSNGGIEVEVLTTSSIPIMFYPAHLETKGPCHQVFCEPPGCVEKYLFRSSTEGEDWCGWEDWIRYALTCCNYTRPNCWNLKRLQGNRLSRCHFSGFSNLWKEEYCECLSVF